MFLRRSPHGERGLKFAEVFEFAHFYQSLSSRRAWIEITVVKVLKKNMYCRSPHGERGLK